MDAVIDAVIDAALVAEYKEYHTYSRFIDEKKSSICWIMVTRGAQTI